MLIFAQKHEMNIRWKTGDKDGADNELYNLSKPTSVITDFGDYDDEYKDEHQLEEMTTR